MHNKVKCCIHFTIIVSFLASCQSCRLIAPYQAPCTPTPLTWKNQTVNEEELPSSGKEFEQCKEELDYWWEIFDDPLLNELEGQALESSYTLWAALEKVIQARAIARIDRASLLPAIGFNPSFNRSGMLLQNLFKDLLSTQANPGQQPMVQKGSSPCAGSQQNSIPSLFRAVQTQYILPFELSYELDFFGKLANTYDSALYSAQASAQAYLSVLLTLTADIAANYFQLRSLDKQKALLERTIASRNKALDILSVRFKAGLIIYIDVTRSEAELARAKADLSDIERLRGIQENTIATLVGIPAPVFSLHFNPLELPPPLIPDGLPSDLLYRRPDIAQVERELAAAYAQIGVAYAEFFPSVNLTASLGLESPVARALLSWKARFWEVGLNVMQSVFDGGRNCANLDYTQSLFRESMANYQQQVLTAFQDVEDSLISLRQRAVQDEALLEASQAARQTLNLSEMRYNQGLINYLDVVDAERTLLQTEQTSVIVLGERYVSTVRLIKALGGGWSPISNYPKCWETD
ncbi:MAG: efflux transporter outer membrane subunit [Candidatus Protochlamydia sp.]|nr:efflux transporter outer membrane subunit [Candidatus Protochlamydia sp.]